MPRHDGSSAAAGATPQIEERRRHDEAAYKAALHPARSSAEALLRAIDQGQPPHEIARISQSALRFVGLLWETSARLGE